MKPACLVGSNWFFALLVVVLPSPVRGEVISKIPGDFGWRKSVPLQLIAEPAVIKDLGLTPDAAQRLQKLHEEIQAKVQAERLQAAKDNAKAPEPRRHVRRYPWNDPLLHQVRNRHCQELDELLTPEQQSRLQEILIQKQRQRTDPLADSDIAAQLDLTKAQRAEIERLYFQVVKAEMDEIKTRGKSQGPGSTTLERAVPEKVIKLLTDEQRESFEKLRGKPLEP
jgi:hypothetical protein